MTAERIFGKVAAVISPTAVMINRGRRDGVHVGMRFAVIYSVGPIVDPDDPSNRMEALNFRKGVLKVTQLHDKMSYCALEPLMIFTRPFLPDLERFQPQTTYPDVESPLFTKIDRTIRVGDVAEQTGEESEEKK